MSISYNDLKTPEGVLQWVEMQLSDGDNWPLRRDYDTANHIADQLSRIDALQTENTRLVLENRELKQREVEVDAHLLKTLDLLIERVSQ